MSKAPEYYWSVEQVSKLKSAYEKGGLREAQAAFPGKQKGTLATKASREGLTKKKPRKIKSMGTYPEVPTSPLSMFGTLTSGVDSSEIKVGVSGMGNLSD